ncbi:hypothetical protein H4219_001650 [Mycoemilia scoparia]|uniref:Transforming acidic coiled-coil-containing protein C-terminal domain-containing protein n=1 Tax=Mycoemilia scoparia TaxID=417184 RepID=A0A9W8A7R0_9FUNG|nr:hypothetical protein H4219_001650 [Mycoemilia scoparia]
MRSLLHRSPSKIYHEHRRQKSEQKQLKQVEQKEKKKDTRFFLNLHKDKSDAGAIKKSLSTSVENTGDYAVTPTASPLPPRPSTATTQGRASDVTYGSARGHSLSSSPSKPAQPNHQLGRKRSIRQYFLSGGRSRAATDTSIHIVHDNPRQNLDHLSVYLTPSNSEQSQPTTATTPTPPAANGPQFRFLSSRASTYSNTSSSSPGGPASSASSTSTTTTAVGNTNCNSSSITNKNNIKNSTNSIGRVCHEAPGAAPKALIMPPSISYQTSVVAPSQRALERVKSLNDMLPHNGLVPIYEQTEATSDQECSFSEDDESDEEYGAELDNDEWEFPISASSRPSTDTAAGSLSTTTSSNQNKEKIAPSLSVSNSPQNSSNYSPALLSNSKPSTSPAVAASSTPSSPSAITSSLTTPPPASFKPTPLDYKSIMDSFPEPRKPKTPEPATTPERCSIDGPGEDKSSGPSKRGIEDIMTPKRPGTIDAIRRETAAYIDTPARAPSAPKKTLLSVETENNGDSKTSTSEEDNLSMKSASSMLVDEDEGSYESGASKLKDATQPEEDPFTIQNSDSPSKPLPQSPAQTMSPETEQQPRNTEDQVCVLPAAEAPASPKVENASPERMLTSPKSLDISQNLTKGSDDDDDAMMTSPAPSPKAEVTPAQVEEKKAEAGENAKSGSNDLPTPSSPGFDPDVIYAASIPLPETPPNKPNLAQSAIPSDFYIPTNWLMNPNTVAQKPRTQASSLIESSPLSDKRSPPHERGIGASATSPGKIGGAVTATSQLIPMTPAPPHMLQNQPTSSSQDVVAASTGAVAVPSGTQNSSGNLLDTLKNEWIPPHKLPKYSEEELSKIRGEYEEKLTEKDDAKEILIKALKEEFVATLRDQKLKFEKEKEQIRVDYANRLKEVETKNKELESKYKKEAEMYKEKLEKAESSSKEAIAKLEADVAKEKESYAEVKAVLDEYVDTSTKFIEEKEREFNGVSRELTKLTLGRQSLEETLTETTTLLEQAIQERDDMRVQLEELQKHYQSTNEINEALRGDVKVAQERCERIQQHAQETLNQANEEIVQLRGLQSKSTKEVALLRAQLGKAEAKLRSAENELNSTRIHNQELFSLCESLERELQR